MSNYNNVGTGQTVRHKADRKHGPALLKSRFLCWQVCRLYCCGSRQILRTVSDPQQASPHGQEKWQSYYHFMEAVGMPYKSYVRTP